MKLSKIIKKFMKETIGEQEIWVDPASIREFFGKLK